MEMDDERLRDAVQHTEILRPPKQSLATFGITSIYYYLVTEPVYAEVIQGGPETVVREGKVIAQRPRIVTPYYLSHLEGFSADARKYFDALLKSHGPHAPGLFYTYRNEPKELNIVADNLLSVVDKLNAEIDQRGDPLTAIIRGEDELWDVSLMKFIYELTKNSIARNLVQMKTKGLLNVDSRGIPSDARIRIEGLFDRAEKGDIRPGELKAELDRWDLFAEYEDRFLALFKKKE